MIDDAYISHLDNVDVLQAWHFLLTQEVPVNIFEGKFQDHRGLVKEGPYRLSRATLSYHFGKHDDPANLQNTFFDNAISNIPDIYDVFMFKAE